MNRIEARLIINGCKKCGGTLDRDMEEKYTMYCVNCGFREYGPVVVVDGKLMKVRMGNGR